MTIECCTLLSGKGSRQTKPFHRSYDDVVRCHQLKKKKRRRKIFETSLDIAGPLDMSMEGLPPTPGMNIHLQTPTKVDVYPVPQEGQQEQLEEQQHKR
ncbi:hypothetical protein E2C01_039062 [Portunus trituberculatus]|uniref:Uncharacterized protein n=1 Tax=Portunus trituberculatus TaxID=210409 RepID=A0A5B7FLQ5_PORTR|nr:hypothetical protein [Portunus trituberculatus]